MEKVLSYFCSSDENVVAHNQVTVYHQRCCSEQLGHAHGFGIHRGSVLYRHQHSDSRDGQFKRGWKQRSGSLLCAGMKKCKFHLVHISGFNKNWCAEWWLSFPFARGIKESEQLVTHSMDEKVSIISRTQNVIVTNAALCDNMGPGKAPGNM